MTERTSVTTDAAGRRVAAKVAGNAEEAVRLEHEAELLEAARHPGVVELVGVDGHGVGAILLTAHLEGPPLAQVGRLPLEESAGILAALASTLADLHDLGLVHGAVSPDHVIVSPGGRPVLCGFAYGGKTGQPAGPRPPTPRAFVDPACADAAVLSPAFDVFALGALAAFLAPDPPAGHALAEVAANATSDDVSARPTARAVAEVLQNQVPAARLPRGLAPQPRAKPGVVATDPLAALRRVNAGPARRPVRPRALVVAGLTAVGVIVGAVLLGGSSGPPVTETASAAPEVLPPDEIQPGPTTTRARPAPSSTSSTPTSSPPTSTAVRNRSCPPLTAVLQADVDGDGCPEALRYTDGVLEAGDLRWALGQAGDQVATGDWGCQGSRTLALFRPSTGEVFRFEGWAGPGQDLTTTAVARVPGGQALRAADVDRDGCHEAVVERVTGVAEVVRLPRARP